MLWLDCSFLLALTAAAAAESTVARADCQLHSVPWQVSLRSADHVCSGALICQEWVLAAAQCSSSPDEMDIWLGSQVLQAPEEVQQIISAAKVIPHQQFNNYTLDFDIMLLKLAQPATLNELVQPIGLPTQCAAAGTLCLASEWGSVSSNMNRNSEPLQCTNLPITPDATCRNAYPGRFTERMLCAGQLDGSQDTCKGDVGSPLVCEDALQGLLSWNKSCSEENHLGLYSKVCMFGDWIHYTITNN